MINRIIFSILFILILSLVIILDTDIGLLLIIKAIPGEAKAQQVSGTLLNGWTIKKFNYKREGLYLAAEEISFHWQARELLKQNLVIDDIQLKNVTLDLPPSSHQTSTALQLPAIDLPINIYLNHILLENIVIHNKNENYLINKVDVSADVVNNILDVHRFSILTPALAISNQGMINLHTWSNIKLSNKLIFNSYSTLPIFTTITGDQNALVLKIKSVKWLDINLILQDYLGEIENISVQSSWFIDTTKAAFPELKKLNGKLQFFGSANGKLIRPIISGRLLAKNITYDTLVVKDLNSSINFSLDERQKLAFQLAGKNISLGDTLLNNIQASLSGTLKSHTIKVNLQMMDNAFFAFSTRASFDNKNTYYVQQAILNARPLNLVLNPINMEISLAKDKLLSYKATFNHGNETLSLQGNTQLFAPEFETKISLSSNKFTVINTDAYKVTIGSDLHLHHNATMTKINGHLDVMNANITPIDLSSTVTLTSDIIYVNDQGQPLHQKSVPLQLFMNVLVKIELLTIDYKGLKAKITGETKLAQTPTTELNAYGQLSIVEGSYKAYGQDLTIQKNSVLTFNHAIDNPQLNITASKKISVSPEYMALPSYQPYLIVGVQVTGMADKPAIRLFSMPSGVSQQDILSYLIFGFPQSQLTNSQASALWSTLSMIDSGNASYSFSSLQKNIQKEFGLSEFGLGSTSEYNAETQQYESGTAFVVSKHITENLTATYNVGLLVPVNVLYLRYQLSKHWALQSDSSALGNGGDIFYTIKRD